MASTFTSFRVKHWDWWERVALARRRRAGRSAGDGPGTVSWVGVPPPSEALGTAVVDPDGYFRLRNSHSNKVLGVENAANANGARVLQWADNGTTDH